jgi:phosphoglycolate phosphatase
MAWPDASSRSKPRTGTHPSRTIFVGDTGWDMGCARNASVGAIGAGWGYHEAEELTSEGAYGVAMAPGGVVALANDWIARNE